MFLRDIDQDTIDAFAKQKGNRKGVHNSAGELLGRRKRRSEWRVLLSSSKRSGQANRSDVIRTMCSPKIPLQVFTDLISYHDTIQKALGDF